MARRRTEDEDEDERPRRRGRPRRDDRDDWDEDDSDDRPRGPLRKPGLATAAGVLWLVAAAIDLIRTAVGLYGLYTLIQVLRIVGPMGGGLPLRLLLPAILGLALSVFGMVLYLVAGIRVLSGSARGLAVSGWLTIAVCVVVGLLILWNGLQLLGANQGGFGGQRDAYLMGRMCGQSLVLVVPLLAGIFAVSCHGRYSRWRASVGRRGDY